MLGSVGGVSTGAVLTGAAQVNESIKEQVHLKISERKHFPHKQMKRKQRSELGSRPRLRRGVRRLISAFISSSVVCDFPLSILLFFSVRLVSLLRLSWLLSSWGWGWGGGGGL